MGPKEGMILEYLITRASRPTIYGWRNCVLTSKFLLQGGLNKFHGQHALRERAKKIDQGILVIR